MAITPGSWGMPSTQDVFGGLFGGGGGGGGGTASTKSPWLTTAGGWSGLSPLQLLGGGASIGGAIGGLLGGSSALGGYSSDVGDIQKQMEEYYQKGMGYLTPYSTAGTGALGQYQTALGQMADPAAFYKNLMSSYQESPLSQFQRQRGLEDVSSSAASRGLLGSTSQGRNLLQFSQGLSTQDMQNYLNNLMGIRGQYMGGLSGLTNLGYGAAGDIAGMYGQLGQGEAELGQAAAQAKAAQKQAQGAGWGDLLGAGIGAMLL